MKVYVYSFFQIKNKFIHLFIQVQDSKASYIQMQRDMKGAAKKIQNNISKLESDLSQMEKNCEEELPGFADLQQKVEDEMDGFEELKKRVSKIKRVFSSS